MNTRPPRYDLASGRQSRLWSSRLWILAGLLGATTVFHMVAVAHDNRAWRLAVHGVAQATAEQHAERLNERLQLYAMESFGPVTGMAASAKPTSQANAPATVATELDALVQAQRAGEACNCRKILPISDFFRVDLSTRQIVRRHLAPISNGGATATTTPAPNSSATTPSAPPDSILATIAKLDAGKPAASRRATVRLTLGPAHDYAVVTLTRRDSITPSPVVFGFVANPHALFQSLFDNSAAQVVSDVAGGAISVDTFSVQVSGSDSTPVFGQESAGHPFRAKVFLHGAMDGMGVSVGLSPSEAQFGSGKPSSPRLLTLGLLMLGTLLVVVIAIGTSRREMFLARARSDFIAGTSHDFRMPLAQILLASETLNLHPDIGGAERTGLTNSIVRETRRLIGMVENVLLYSRSGAVEMKPSLQRLSVHELIEDVRESVQLAADENGQTIVNAASATVAVMADRQLLRQAMVNLVDNAMKYGAPAQTVTIGAAGVSQQRVHIWVDDEGPGIPEAQRARVFEPYERLTRDQASERAGSGLGLAVVYHIAKVCGGRVWVESAPTGGARVVLELAAAS